MEKYDIDQILELGNNPKKLAKACSTFDGLIIVNLCSALQKDGKERERLLDRLLGKALLRVESKSEVSHVKTLRLESLSDDQITALMDALRGPETIEQESHGLLPPPESDSEA